MKRLKVIVISIFIIINFMMMIRAQIDDSAPITNFIYRPITFVQNYLSMWRGWNMFAPNPLRSNYYVDAKVSFADGSHYIWNFPNSSNISSFQKYLYAERFRKYSVDGLRLNSNSHLWPDAAKYVLRQMAKSHFRKVPLKVTLRRRWKDIPNWNDRFIKHKELSNVPFNTYEFYTHEVLNAISRN